MKTKFIILILIAGLISACGSQATEAPASAPTEEPAPATEVVPTLPAPADTAVPPTEAPVQQPTAASSATVSFTNDIAPILESRCLSCHGGERTQEGLSVKTYADIMAGSSNGPVVVPGDAANSLLAELVANQKMPKRGPKLTPAQVQLITDWVNQGALDN